MIISKIRKGESWTTIFPGVASLHIDPEADDIGISICITKKEGESVQIVPEGSPGATAVVLKRVNELDFYSLYFRDLKEKLGLNQHQVQEMLTRYKVRDDSTYFRAFMMGRQEHKRFSHKALELLLAKKQEYVSTLKKPVTPSGAVATPT